MEIYDELTNALAELEEEKVIAIVDNALKGGASIEISELILACQRGMEIVGERYSAGEYYLPDLIMSAEILKQVMGQLTIKSETNKSDSIGKIVLGTVRGDIHFIGKDIVCTLFKSAGFEVTDLGVDVSEEKFVEAVKKVQPQILAMSALLNSALEAMKSTVDAVKEAGLRDEIRVIIGGNAVSKEMCEYIGADAFTTNAYEGVQICKEWVDND